MPDFVENEDIHVKAITIIGDQLELSKTISSWVLVKISIYFTQILEKRNK